MTLNYYFTKNAKRKLLQLISHSVSLFAMTHIFLYGCIRFAPNGFLFDIKINKMSTSP